MRLFAFRVSRVTFESDIFSVNAEDADQALALIQGNATLIGEILDDNTPDPDLDFDLIDGPPPCEPIHILAPEYPS